MPSKTKAHIAVLAANFIFGVNFSTVKYITPSVIQPFGLNVCRVSISLILFWLLYLLKPSKPGIAKKDIPLFILCAITGVAINQLFFIKGLSLTTSIHASLLSLSTPIIVTIVAAWLLKEKLTTAKLTGLALGVSGAGILIAKRSAAHTGTNILLGDVLIIINAVSYGFYFVLVRPLMQRYTPLHVIRWVFTLGALIIIPVGWKQFSATDWSAFSLYHWLCFFFVIIGATFLAYLFNTYGVSALGPSITGAYIYTQPVFAAVIAILFLGEQFDLYKGIAAILILAGVYIVNLKRRAV